MLPLVTLPVKLHGLQLDVNVAPEHATHVLEVPRTQPRALAVTSAGTTQQVVFGVDELRQVHVSPGVLVMRTLVGDEYELEAEAASATALLEIEMLPAGRGMSLIIRYGDAAQIRTIVVDCGSRPTGKLLVGRLGAQEGDSEEPLELLVLTHGDDDRIGGAIEVLKNLQLATRFGDVWFNGLPPMEAKSVAR
jgi:beta-lactamase superfamily II metal-dependent hydrolase